MTYLMEFTPLARAFAEAKSSLAEVERVARLELDELDIDIKNLFFHTIEVGGVDFILMHRKGVLMIDTMTVEEGPILDDGPFKGMRVMFPAPDTDAKED